MLKRGSSSFKLNYEERFLNHELKSRNIEFYNLFLNHDLGTILSGSLLKVYWGQ